MSEKQMVVYIYDGTFEGFLCCVYNFYYNRLKPADIVSRENYNPTFYENVIIDTDYEQAYKVRFAIEEKIGRANLDFLCECFLTCLENKEMYMLRYIVKGFKVGDKINGYVTDSDVSALNNAHRHQQREVQKFLGLVRFRRAGDVYVAKIAPKNQILPLMVWHFTGRFADQRFMIYDENNKQALVYANKNYKIIRVEDIQLPPISEDEKRMEQLWKNFYNTIAIKERYNPKCRMNFMPKRMWSNLPEMNNSDTLPPKSAPRIKNKQKI